MLGACGSSEQVDIPAAGDVVRTDYALSGFSEVSVVDLFEAEITRGPDFKVVVECEKALVPYLQVEVRGGRLVVGLDPNYDYSFEEASQRLEVTLPELTFASVGNHSALQLTSFTMEETLLLKVADFSTLNGEIDASDVRIKVSNHSTLTLGGSAADVVGEVTGMSTANLSGLEAAAIEVDTDQQSTLRQ